MHFSARRAHSGDSSLDLIALLRGAVSERCRQPALAGTPLAALPGRLGDDFARGHPEATGGMVATEDFAHLALVGGWELPVAGCALVSIWEPAACCVEGTQRLRTACGSCMYGTLYIAVVACVRNRVVARRPTEDTDISVRVTATS